MNLNLTRRHPRFLKKSRRLEELSWAIGAVVMASAAVVFWSAYGLRTRWIFHEYVWDIVLFVPAISLVWFCVGWLDFFEKERQKRIDRGDVRETMSPGAVFMIAFAAGMIACGVWSDMFQLSCLHGLMRLLLVATILVPWAITIPTVSGLSHLIKRIRMPATSEGDGY